MLTRLVYHSENHLGADGGGMIEGLNAILETSQRHNAQDGITGALLFDRLWFIQILEGEREAVSALLRRIQRDERNDRLVVMDCRPAGTRLFANWWMGLAMLRDDGALYARHGIGPKLDPRKMSAEQALGIAVALAATVSGREIAA